MDVPGGVLVRQARGRTGEELRVRLHRQLVVRQVRGLQRDRTLDVVQRHREALAGKGVHQIKVEVVQAGVLRQLHRALGLGVVVDAAQALQAAVVETLDAEADAVHAGG